MTAFEPKSTKRGAWAAPLANSTSRRQRVAERWVRGLGRVFARVALFEVQGTRARVVALHNIPSDGTIDHLSLLEATPLRWSVEAASPMIGFGGAPGGAIVAASLGISQPRTYAVIPLVVRKKLVAFAYADNEAKPLPLATMGEVFRYCADVLTGKNAKRGSKQSVVTPPMHLLVEPKPTTTSQANQKVKTAGAHPNEMVRPMRVFEEQQTTAAEISAAFTRGLGELLTRPHRADENELKQAETERLASFDRTKQYSKELSSLENSTRSHDSEEFPEREAERQHATALDKVLETTAEREDSETTSDPLSLSAIEQMAQRIAMGGDFESDDESNVDEMAEGHLHPQQQQQLNQRHQNVACTDKAHAEAADVDTPKTNQPENPPVSTKTPRARPPSVPPPLPAWARSAKSQKPQLTSWTPELPEHDPGPQGTFVPLTPALFTLTEETQPTLSASYVGVTGSEDDTRNESVVRPRRTLLWGARVGAPIVLLVAIASSVLLPLAPASAGLERTTVNIAPRATVGQIAETLAQQSVIRSPWAFQFLARLSGADRQLRAGTYELTGTAWAWTVLGQLRQGQVHQATVTIPEGLTVREIAELLEDHDLANASKFELACRDQAMLTAYGIHGNSAEGFLMPETYSFATGTSESQLVEAMVKLFFTRLAELPTAQSAGGTQLYRQVTVASIVEREATATQEMPRVAGVIYNRLEKGDRLESCATVQYVLGRPKAHLTLEDVRIPSPYNTYLHPGLPPGPIANPGLAALKASFEPEKHDYRFFVARNDGTDLHVFSRSYSAHLAAIRRLSGNKR